MEKRLELLAPGGDVNAIKAAILAGADALYCGLAQFNARDRAQNLTFEELVGVINLAHDHSCKVYLTLNIVLLETEIPTVVKLLNKLNNIDLDGIIVQDLGLLYLLTKYFKTIKVHASTQMTTHNRGQIEFLARYSVNRVNLSRELNLKEIEDLHTIAKANRIETEVFVHGSYCIAFSGLCYMSSVLDGKSGNRGRCSQPCRMEYQKTEKGIKYPLNLKDNSAYFDLPELVKTGVHSLKIEGRIKGFNYVYTVVEKWRKHLDNYLNNQPIDDNIDDLYSVFNRDFTNGYLRGNVSRSMFIDSPRDFSRNYFSQKDNQTSSINKSSDKAADQVALETIVNFSKIEKIPMQLVIKGQQSNYLEMTVFTPSKKRTLYSKSPLQKADDEKSVLTKNMIFKKMKAINQSHYNLDQIDIKQLDKGLFLPFRDLAQMRWEIINHFTTKGVLIEPVTLPAYPSEEHKFDHPELSLLVSSPDDIDLSANNFKIFYKLPNDLVNREDLINLFCKYRQLIPWFPAILIGDNYLKALDILNAVRPEIIVANNTGIGLAARERNIPWIAGPYLNLTNSYSMRCLQKDLNCKGGFVSSELNKYQINSIKQPKDFQLFFSIFHPVLMMQSRACLLQQIVGCEKEIVDSACLAKCQKSASIIDRDDCEYFVHKGKGNYAEIYYEHHYLNTDILEALPGKFSTLMIDLREIQTATGIPITKQQLTVLFDAYRRGEEGARVRLQKTVRNTTCQQFEGGV